MRPISRIEECPQAEPRGRLIGLSFGSKLSYTGSNLTPVWSSLGLVGFRKETPTHEAHVHDGPTNVNLISVACSRISVRSPAFTTTKFLGHAIA